MYILLKCDRIDIGSTVLHLEELMFPVPGAEFEP
jgi:hypothetical protein